MSVRFLGSPAKTFSFRIPALLTVAFVGLVAPRIFADPVPTTAPAPATPIAIASLPKKIDFEAQVLPIFKRNCLACHNQTDAEGDLVLETPATIAKGGENGPVVVPKKSDQSSLLKNVTREIKPYMPPKSNKVGAEVLKPDELAVIKTWIDQGATGTVSAKAKPIQWRPLPPGLHPILAVAVTGDGQFAACGRANQIFIYHVPTGQVVARLTDPKLAEKTGRSGYRDAAQRDFVQSLAFSPDGRLLASGEYRMVKLWQREPNLPQFALGSDPTTVLATSPDGKWLATAGKDHVIRLWDAATGQAVKELPGHTDTVRALAFSPDNTRLASGSTDKTVRIWEIAGAKVLAQAETAGEVSSVAWTLGGKQLASGGGDNSIHLWDANSPAGAPLKPLKELTDHTQPVTCLAVSTDGRTLLSGSADGSVRQWAADRQQQIRQLDQGVPVSSVAISPNGKILAAAGGTSAKLWSSDKGQPMAELKGDHRAQLHLSQIEQALALAKADVAYWKTTLEANLKAQKAKVEAAAKADTTLKAADQGVKDARTALTAVTDDQAKPAAEEVLKKAEAALSTATRAQQSAQLGTKQADQAAIDAKDGAAKATAAEQKAGIDIEAAKKAVADSVKPIRAVAFAPNNLTVATAGDDQSIHTWSVESGSGFDVYPGQLGAVQALTWTSDGRLVSAAAQNGAVVWRTVPSWHLARAIGSGDEKSPLANRVLALGFSNDGQWLATGGGAPSRSGEVKIWKSGDGSLVREITPSHSDTVFSLDFSPDGKYLATASADKFVKVFDTGSGQLVKALSGHTHYVLGVGWKADGRLIASSGADKVVKLWSFPAGEQIKTVEGFTKEVTSVRFVGTGGEMLTASGDTKVRMLKEDGTTLRDFGGSKGFLFSSVATRDGQWILSGGQDSVFRIWNAATGKILFSLDPPPTEQKAATVK